MRAVVVLAMAGLLLGATGCVQRLPDKAFAAAKPSGSPRMRVPGAQPHPTGPRTLPSLPADPAVPICQADNLKFAQRAASAAGTSYSAEIEFVVQAGGHCRVVGRIRVGIVNGSGGSELLPVDATGTAGTIVMAATSGAMPGEAAVAHIPVSWTAATPGTTCAAPTDLAAWRLTVPFGSPVFLRADVPAGGQPCNSRLLVGAPVVG